MYTKDAYSNIGDSYHQRTKYYPPQGHKSKLVGGGDIPDLDKKNLPGTVLLPKPQTEGGPPIWETTSKRRSIRHYHAESLSQSQLSQVLWAAQGIVKETSQLDFRTSPSAGGLYPMETYVIIRRVAQLKAGIYRYLPRQHALQPLAMGGVIPHLAAACMDQSAVAEASAVLAWTAVIERCTDYYQQRGYRYIYMEAGHICQNVYLAATALGLGSCAVGAFFDDEINQLLGIDGSRETVIYLAGLGHV